MTLLASSPPQTIASSSPIAQVIPGRLYFTSYAGQVPKSDAKTVYVDIDEQVHYDAFYEDFGPLNLSVLYRFCQTLNAILEAQRPNKRIFLYTDMNAENRVNAVYLIAAYMIIYQNLTAEQAYLRLQPAEPPTFVGFRDAALGPPSYLLHVQHVIQSIEKAVKFKWLDFDDFDPDEYEHFERVENGDLNWIIPGKILSFCGPHDKSYTENGYPYHSPEVYFDYFRTNNVTAIIRLNKKIYDAKRFTQAGFDHHDLFFIDGSTPSDDIVLRFIEIVDSAKGAVAVHCKAGLGRTGTLIACWMMKHFRLTAPQCMGWLRVCRPGSVIGPQQHFLIDKQSWCWRLWRDEKLLKESEAKAAQEALKTPPEAKPVQNGTTPKETGTVWGAREAMEAETAIDAAGKSQGDRLCEIKATRQHRQQNRPLRTTTETSTSASSSPAFVFPRTTHPQRTTRSSGIGARQKPSSTSPMDSRTDGGCTFSSATTPIKQLKLSHAAAVTTAPRMTVNFGAPSSAENPTFLASQSPKIVLAASKPTGELLRNLRSSSGDKPMTMIGTTATTKQNGTTKMDAEEAYTRRSGATKIPIQKVSVTSSTNTSGTNNNPVPSTNAGRAGGLYRKHFSSSRLLKPYLPTTTGHPIFTERALAPSSNSGGKNPEEPGGGATKRIQRDLAASLSQKQSTSATTSFGRALKSQYARINATNRSVGLQTSNSSANIHQHVQQHDHPNAHQSPHHHHQQPQQQFHSPMDGQTNCKYELRPRNQIHLPSRYVLPDMATSPPPTGAAASTGNSSSTTAGSSPFALSRHAKASRSSAAILASRI